MKRFYLSLAALTVLLSGVLLFNVFNGQSNAAGPRDCEPNSIIECGALTPKELKDRYNANKPGDLHAIYADYGLSAQEVTNAGTKAKMGAVHKDGRITVGNEVVATDARSLGRHFKEGSTIRMIGGKKYYERTPARSFASNSITAYIFFNADGTFKAAILTSCGNPVSGKPKPKPVYKCEGLVAKPINRTKYSFTATASASGGASIVSYTYTIKNASGTVIDTKTQASTSKQNVLTYDLKNPGTYTITVTVNVKVGNETKPASGPKCATKVTVEAPKPQPKYSCDLLTVTKIDRTNFKFETDYTVENATFKELVYVIRNANGDEIARVAGPNYTQTTEGTFTVQAYVTVTVNGQEKTVTDDKCKAQFTVTPPNKVEVCNPETGEIIVVDEKDKDKYKPVGDEACQETPVVPPELPQTGPMELLGGGLGLGAIVAASYYWYSSRRGLLNALLNR